MAILVTGGAGYIGSHTVVNCRIPAMTWLLWITCAIQVRKVWNVWKRSRKTGEVL